MPQLSYGHSKRKVRKSEDLRSMGTTARRLKGCSNDIVVDGNQEKQVSSIGHHRQLLNNQWSKLKQSAIRLVT